MAELTVQQDAANASTGKWYQSIAAIVAVGPWWVSLILAVTLLLGPFVVIVGAAAVILTAFAVAGTATLVLLGGLAIGFAAIGAAVVALGGGMGTAGAVDALVPIKQRLVDAQQALKDFNALHTGAASGPSATANNRVYDAQQALNDFHARHPGALTLAQVQQQEDLQLRLSRAQAGDHGSSGGLTLAQQQQKEDLTLRLARAQDAYNIALANTHTPISILAEKIGAMGDVLAKQAQPLAALILLWVGSAIPAVTQLAQTLMTWFGERLPGVLGHINKVIHDLSPAFSAFAQFLGAMFDRNEGKIGPLVEQFIRLGLSITTGLLTALESLTNWFIVRLPTHGPVVSQIFGFLGSVVQGVASVWGKFADWLVANWPAITTMAAHAIKSISDEWVKIAPQWDEAQKNILPKLWQALGYVADNAGALVPIVAALLIIFLDIATVVLAIVGAIEALIIRLGDLGRAIANSPLGLLVGNLSFSGGPTGPVRPPAGKGNPYGTHTTVVNVAVAPNNSAKTVTTQFRRLVTVS